MQLGQQVGELESQMGLMEHQCRSLNQDKEQLEEEVQDKQALLEQAAAAAERAQAQAAQDAQTALDRSVGLSLALRPADKIMDAFIRASLIADLTPVHANPHDIAVPRNR